MVPPCFPAQDSRRPLQDRKAVGSDSLYSWSQFSLQLVLTTTTQRSQSIKRDKKLVPCSKGRHYHVPKGVTMGGIDNGMNNFSLSNTRQAPPRCLFVQVMGTHTYLAISLLPSSLANANNYNLVEFFKITRTSRRSIISHEQRMAVQPVFPYWTHSI